MSGVHRIASGLTSFLVKTTLFFHDYAWLAFLTLLLVAVAAMTQLSHVHLDTSVEGLLGRESASYQEYSRFVQQFGHDWFITVTIEADDVLSPAVLDKVRQLHADIEAGVPHVERVLSLAGAPYLYSLDGTIYASRMTDNWPASEHEWHLQQQRIEHYTPFRNFLVDEDRHLTVVILQLKARVATPEGTMRTVATPEYVEAVSALRSLLGYYADAGFDVEITGEAAADAALQGAVLRDLVVLGLLSFLVGTLLFWVLFRRVLIQLLPVVVYVLTATCCIALMVLLGKPLQISITLLPPLVITFGLADNIHLLNALFRHYRGPVALRDALEQALQNTALPMLLTSVTTAIGMLSFAFVSIDAQASIGILGACAALLAFVFTLLSAALACRWMPAAFASRPHQSMRRGSSLLLVISKSCVSLASRYPRVIVSSSLVLFLVSASMATQLRFSYDTLDWLPRDWTEIRGIERLDRYFGGSASFDLVIDSGREDGIYDPVFMDALGDLHQALESLADDGMVGSVFSIHHFLERVGLTMDGQVHRYADLKNGDRVLWRNLRLLKLSMGDDFSSLVTDDGRFLHLRLLVRREDAIAFHPLRHAVDDILAARAWPFETTLTGLLPVLYSTLEEITAGARQSYLVAVVAITLLMVLFLSSVREGVIVMLPNLLPITLVLALLWWLDMPLDVLTAMVAAIMAGLVVDDTIHFLFAFRKSLATQGNVIRACQAALDSSGRAMIMTTIILGASFSVLYLSQLGNLVTFATMSIGIISIGLVADFVLLPALMILLHGNTTSRHIEQS